MDLTQIGRLALRQEGGMWCAYYAMPNTMEGALLLGTLRMPIAAQPQHKVAFIALMQGAVADLIEEHTGTRLVWNSPVSAPEHERAGNA